MIDTNKLKLLCGDYYSEDQYSARSTIHLGPDHWKHKSIGNISQLETRPLIG